MSSVLMARASAVLLLCGALIAPPPPAPAKIVVTWTTIRATVPSYSRCRELRSRERRLVHATCPQKCCQTYHEEVCKTRCHPKVSAFCGMPGGGWLGRSYKADEFLFRPVGETECYCQRACIEAIMLSVGRCAESGVPCGAAQDRR